MTVALPILGQCNAGKSLVVISENPFERKCGGCEIAFGFSPLQASSKHSTYVYTQSLLLFSQLVPEHHQIKGVAQGQRV